MKAIIPVAGAGTKLRPHTYTQPKALIPLAGKTVLGIIIDQLEEAGIRDFIFIVGYLGDKIQDYVRARHSHLTCHFVYQNERSGTGPAIDLARELVGPDPVFIVLGDTIADYNIAEIIKSPDSMIGLKKVDDPRNFGVAEVNEEGYITRMVEKPAIPKSNLAMVGIYKIVETHFLFTCIKRIIELGEKQHEEFSITDALECMIQKGARLRYFKVQNWFDCGKKETLLESNATMLKKFGGMVPEAHVYENTIIIPPVSIGEGCDIRNSVIGPNVSIGDHTEMHYTIVKNSIIGAYTKLHDIVLDDSLIGSDTSIKGETRSLNIGDDTNIDLG